jgi:DNA-binding NtrC family response regulator
MKVLIVDDDDAAGSSVLHALAPDHTVRLVRTIHEAMAVLQEWEPDAVVCEIALRNGGADAVLTWLRAHRPTVRRLVYCAGTSPMAFDVDLAHAWVMKPAVEQLVWQLRAPCAA